MNNNIRKNLKRLEIGAGFKSKRYWYDLWTSKHLFYFLAWRDIVVRYKQTLIGVMWSVMQPVLTMGIFVLVFEKVAKLPSVGEAPYAVMVFSALIPWQFFSNSVNQSSNSVVGNSGMISKIYFPRMIIPISSIFVSLIDSIVAFIVLLLIMLFYSYPPTYKIVFIPIFLCMSIFLSIGIGLFFSAMMVRYRDFRILIPFFLQVGIYITPVGFSSDIVPEYLRFWYSFNPMVGIVEGFRWAIIGGEAAKIYIPGFIVSIVLIIVLLMVGVFTFRKMEKTFADVI